MRITQSDRNKLVKQMMENIKHWPHEDLISHTQTLISEDMRKMDDFEIVEYCEQFGIEVTNET
jgi:hypothetical protein